MSDNTTPPTTVQEVCNKAVEILRERGWWQGSYFDKTKPRDTAPVCAVGAINVAVCGDPSFTRGSAGMAFDGIESLYDLKVDAQDALSLRVNTSIISFNDRPGTTADDVIRVFEEVAHG